MPTPRIGVADTQYIVGADTAYGMHGGGCSHQGLWVLLLPLALASDMSGSFIMVPVCRFFFLYVCAYASAQPAHRRRACTCVCVCMFLCALPQRIFFKKKRAEEALPQRGGYAAHTYTRTCTCKYRIDIRIIHIYLLCSCAYTCTHE